MLDLLINAYNNPLVYWIGVILILIVIFYVLGTRNYHQFDDIPGVVVPRYLPFIGHMHHLFAQTIRDYDQMLMKKHGPYIGQYFMNMSHILTTDTEILKQCFVKEAGSFLYRRDVGLNGYPMRRAVSVLKGDDWKRVRSLITPTFTKSKIDKMTPLITESVEKLAEILKGYAETQEDIPVKECFYNLTMEIIARTMFAIDVNIQGDPDNQFTKYANEIFNVKAFLDPLLYVALLCPCLTPYVMKIKPAGLVPPKANDFFVNLAKQAMAIRSNNSEDYNDFLALMMKAHSETLEEEQQKKKKKEGGTAGDWTSESASASRGLTTEEIIAQSMTFMLAGYETSASTLHFCAYYLAMNPEVQDKCYQEMMREVGSERLTYDNASRLVYIDQCIQETLRLSSPVSRLERVAQHDITLTRQDGLTLPIKKGMSIQVPIFALHMDPDVYPEPEKFNPDRFSFELKESRDPYYFMPFGQGPRNCIGMRFANLEMKMALASIIRAVKLVPCDKTPKEIVYAIANFTKPKQSIILRCEKRSE